MYTVMRKCVNFTFFFVLTCWLVSDLATGDDLRHFGERTGIRICYGLADLRDVVGEKASHLWGKLDVQRQELIRRWEELGKADKVTKTEGADEKEK